jgi:hypothetical protein
MRAFLFCLALFTFSAVASSQSLEDNQLYYKFKSEVRSIQQSENHVAMEFVYCVQAYEKLIASGVSPSTRVPADDSLDWKGTLAEIKEKYCVAPEKKMNADLAAKHAPYKAVLKGDKLRLVIDWKTGTVYEYALAGGKYTGDAKALAAARVWFLDVGAPSNEAQYCVDGGKRSSVRRYTFDAEHKLISTTEKAYCGTPPASAYR